MDSRNKKKKSLRKQPMREYKKPARQPNLQQFYKEKTQFKPSAVGRAWDKLSPLQRVLLIIMLIEGGSHTLPLLIKTFHPELPPDEDDKCKQTHDLSPSTYMNIPVTILPEKSTSNCIEKTTGIVGGKICDINENGVKTKYIMKVTGSHRFFKANSHHVKTNAALHNYNTRMVKMIGASTPETRLFYQKKGGYRNRMRSNIVCASLFHASKWMADAETFRAFKARIKHTQPKLINKNLSLETVIRMELSKRIGERGLAQLAVSSTLINDLIANEDNWGIVNNSLVIFDMDIAPRMFRGCSLCPDLKGFYYTAIEMPDQFCKEEIYFSLSMITEMRNIYNNLSRHSIVPLHSSVDIPHETFNQLAKAYENACTHTIEDIKSNITGKNFKYDTPNSAINDYLKKNLIIELDQLALTYEGVEASKSDSHEIIRRFIGS